MSFGDKLRAALEREGISQSDLARRLGIRPQAVNQWLSGSTTPRGARLQEIAGAIGISVPELLGDAAGGSHSHNLARAELLGMFDGLDPQGRDMLLRLARSLKGESAPESSSPRIGPEGSGCVVALKKARK